MPAGGGSAAVVEEKRKADAAKAAAAAAAAAAAQGPSPAKHPKNQPPPKPKPKPPPPPHPKPAPPSADAGDHGNSNYAGSTAGAGTGTSTVPAPSGTPNGTGDLAGLGIGNSSNLGDLFPGADAAQIDTLLASGGYGEALRYKLGLIEADLLKLKNEADAANQRAQIALDQGKLALAQKEEADANAIKVRVNQLTEQQQRYTAQGNYADQLMKLGELPENAYKYAFARYGLTTPQGGQSMALPEPDAVKGMLLNPTATGQPGATSVVAPPPGPMAGLMPQAAPPPTPTPTPAPLPRPSAAPALAGPAAAPALLPPSGGGSLAGASLLPKPTGPPENAAPPAPPPQPTFAEGGVAGIHPMAEGLMKHALDMAKQGGALLKHHLAPQPTAGQAPSGGLGAMMPSGPPAPYGSGAPGLPGFAGGGLAGLVPVVSPGGGGFGGVHPAPVNPDGGAGFGGIHPAPANPPATPPLPPTPAPVYPGGTSPYGMPNENQQLGSYSGPMLTLPPALQQLFAQTGHQESGVPISPPPSWMMPHLGTPSAQSLRFLSPDELANTQGFERDIEGKPIDAFKNDIAQHAEQGSGLEVPHAFARGGIAGLPSGAPAVAPYAAAGLPPNDQTAGVYPGFALGGVAGIPTGTGKGVPLPPPPPQAGTAQVPGVGQVAAGPATFGDAGPEAAVPLNSPGGPLAMQALAANQGGAPPSAGNLGALLGPTSTDVGPQLSQAMLPLTNIPTTRLGPGVRSEAVGRLQQALEQAGYLQMPPSANYGFYGPVTVHAVRRFQQDQGITAGDPGIWNKQSASALKSLLQGPASAPPGPSPYSMRGAGAPGDLTGPQPGPAAGGLPSPSGSGGLGGMMPSLGM